ncbi:MAG: tetratricopeptide repeat protein [Pseudomonadota bacterium]
MTPKSIRRSTVVLLATLVVAGCQDPDKAREEIQSLDSLNVIDENNLNNILLDFADPEQAVVYFQSSLAKEPDRLEFKQGYAQSLARAGRLEEAVLAYQSIEATGELTNTDRLSYTEALIQTGEWEKGKAQLAAIPPTVETYDRYRLEAIVSDFQKSWDRSDAYYEQARELTTRPAAIFNNWGISKAARGDRPAAEEMFTRAISFDSSLFSAKNNLAISRATRKVYELPIVPMSKQEEAELLHNIALQAIRNGDVDIGRGLLEEAVETHPQFFSEATAKLEALDRNVAR